MHPLRGKWVVAQSEDERLAPPDESSWDPMWGDRCQQIVWIGIGVDQAKITTMLDTCLLTDDEMAMGPEGWAVEFQDDLPEWGYQAANKEDNLN